MQDALGKRIIEYSTFNNPFIHLLVLHRYQHKYFESTGRFSILFTEKRYNSSCFDVNY